MEIDLLGEKLEFLPQKAIYWNRQGAVIIADPHFGKVSHFRQAGIAIPAQMVTKQLDGLRDLLDSYAAKRLIVVGDFFHSTANKELDLFCDFVEKYPDLQVDLVLGNHDRHSLKSLQQLKFGLHADYLKLGPFTFSHYPLGQYTDRAGKMSDGTLKHIEKVRLRLGSDSFNICGHLHPALVLRGIANESAKLPCFLVSDNELVLPAFSDFTQMAAVSSTSATQIYLCLPDKVLKV